MAVLIGALWIIADRQALAIDLPAAGVNASGYSYYTTALPFVDVAHMGNQWHSVQADGTKFAEPHEIPLTEDSYPASLAEGEIARSLIFTHNGGHYPTGLYTLSWGGSGEVRLLSPGLTVVDSKPGQITYRVADTNPIGLLLDIMKTDPANPVQSISVRAPFPEAAENTFSPIYKRDLAHYGVVRHLGWNNVNNSKVSKWSERTEPNDFHWGTAAGVPYEIQIQLSNELKEDLWLTVPHLADDDYVRNLARLVGQQLSPDLRVWVEYSNEVWNGSFSQFHYANDVLKTRYGVANSVQAYGRRSAEVFDIFSSQIPDSRRIVRVIAGQNANSWVLEQGLVGATVGGTLKADVAAVAPYFTVDIDRLYQQHLHGAVNLDDVFSELRTSIDSVIKSAAKNRDIAAARGLPLVAYEGGQHLVARPGEQHNDKNFVDLLTTINRDPRMGDLYTYMLDKWYGAGGKSFVFIGETIGSTKWGSWGLKENYLDDNAPKFQAVQEYLKRLEQARADLNKDSAVDQLDYDIWRVLFGSLYTRGADADGSGSVDAADYVFWRALASQSQAAVSARRIRGPAGPGTAYAVARCRGRDDRSGEVR